jgi:polygalacturonase
MFKSVLLLLAGAALFAPLLSATGETAPVQPKIPARTFNLKDYGAVGDGATLNTAAIKTAIAAVKAAGGGTLVVPAGRWLTGPVDLGSELDFHLEAGAVLQFSPEFALYNLGNNKYRPLLLASDAHDTVISGSGTINGSGDVWWPEARRFKAEARAKGARSDTSSRPNLVGFERCARVRLEGITLTNSPKFNFVPARCTEVTVDGITILNPADSPNTDGIDPANTRRMLITHCTIDTGDDNIAVKAGAKNGDAVRDLLVENCTFLHGHGCSLGSELGAGVNHMTVRNCTFDGTDIGVRFKSDRLRGGVVENVVYENLTMKHVGQPIVITSYYVGLPQPGQHDEKKPVTADTPVWRNISIRHLTATAGTRNAGLIIGLPEMPAGPLLLENINIEAPAGLRIGYTKDLILRDVKITARTGEPFFFEDTVANIKRVE